MPSENGIYNQVRKITEKLIEVGLSVEQNFPSCKDGCVAYSGEYDNSIALKDIGYDEIYERLDLEKNYNIKLIDGALLQFLYRFDGDGIVSHRLSFFPSPNLESFQNEPSVYEDDEIYADILRKNIVTFPIRFDFDPAASVDLYHPVSHVTFGQYKNCRIPISKPLTPELFISFILRNFYNTAFHKYEDEFEVSGVCFDETITDKEKSVLHFGVS